MKKKRKEGKIRFYLNFFVAFKIIFPFLFYKLGLEQASIKTFGSFSKGLFWFITNICYRSVSSRAVLNLPIVELHKSRV